jgi:hypothetical protein
MSGNLADVRVSNVARYTGSTYTVPTAPFATDSSTLLLLKSLAGQIGTTLEVQGRGLNAVSLGATRSVQSYPPAPMSSYLLDTTSNASVTYGQGKYIASASTEQTSGGVAQAWKAFDKNTGTSWNSTDSTVYNNSSPYNYTGSVRTVDILGNSYAGEWLQIQLPVSVLISSYSITPVTNPYTPSSWFIIGSRDGINWTFVDQRTGVIWVNNTAQTFSVGATQAYTYYRIVNNQVTGNTGIYGANIVEWTLNGTEESLCVTSDAKVGVGIANPQRALEVAGDLVVSGTVSCGNPVSFRNRIINGDMRIAQRGTSATVTNLSYYTVDRWYVFAVSGAFQMNQQTLASSDTPYQLGFRNSVRFTSLTPANIEMGHNIEGYNIQDLNWGTSFGSPITISFWFRSLCTAGSVFSLAVRNVSTYAYLVPFTINAPSTWQYYTATIPPPPNGTTWPTTNAAGLTIEIGSYNTGYQTTALSWNSGNFIMATGSTNIMATAGNYIELTGVQLEKGTVATPFEVRGFAQELALCQRYYHRIGIATGQAPIVCPMTIIAATTAEGVYKLPMTMRSNVIAVSASGTFTLDWFTLNANSVGALAVIAGQTSTDVAALVATSVGNGTAGSVTVGQNRFLITNSGYVDFSAEL